MFVTRWRTSFTCTGGELPEIRSLSDVIRVLAGTVALFAAAPVWGQVAAPSIDLVAAQPFFEVASLKRIGPAPPVQGNSGSVRVTEGMRRSGDTVRCVLPLASLLTVAFHLSQWQIQGPEWLGVERYQLDAKMPAGSSSSNIPVMLQTLLKDRLNLQHHFEDRATNVYNLTVAKGGLKLEHAAATARRTESMETGHYAASTVDLDRLADWLSAKCGRPVLNATGIQDKFILDLRWDSEPGPDGSDAGVAASLSTLGLRLESKKALYKYLMVDQVRRDPTEN